MMTQPALIRKRKLVEHLQSEDTTTIGICLKELHISRRTFFRYLEELKEVGANISYCKQVKSYKIEDNFDFIQVMHRG